MAPESQEDRTTSEKLLVAVQLTGDAGILILEETRVRCRPAGGHSRHATLNPVFGGRGIRPPALGSGAAV